MLNVTEQAKPFSLTAAEEGKITTASLQGLKDKWVVLFFYPKNFTFVCPTEVIGFHKRIKEFRKEGAVVLGISPDPVESHLAWAEELGGVGYPLLSDPDRTVCRAYGVLDPSQDLPLRATFIIDPEGVIAYAVASHANVGRSVSETLRVLQALKTQKMCPAEWQPGEETIEARSSF